MLSIRRYKGCIGYPNTYTSSILGFQISFIVECSLCSQWPTTGFCFLKSETGFLVFPDNDLIVWTIDCFILLVTREVYTRAVESLKAMPRIKDEYAICRALNNGIEILALSRLAPHRPGYGRDRLRPSQVMRKERILERNAVRLTSPPHSWPIDRLGRQRI